MEADTNKINTVQAKDQGSKIQTQKIQEKKIQSQKMQVQKIQQYKVQRQKAGRLAGLDTIRGITLLSMMLYHTCWDLVFLFGKKIPGYSSQNLHPDTCFQAVQLSCKCNCFEFGHITVSKLIYVQN